MFAIFMVLVLIASIGSGLLFMRTVDRLAVVIFTTYMVTVVYGSTYYQTKLILKLFRKKRKP